MSLLNDTGEAAGGARQGGRQLAGRRLAASTIRSLLAELLLQAKAFGADAGSRREIQETALTDLANRVNKRRTDLQTRRGNTQQQIDGRLAEVLRGLDGELARATGAIEKTLDERAWRAKDEYERAVEEIKRGIQDKCWLADSVLEAAQIRGTAEQRAVGQVLANQQSAIIGEQNRAIELLQVYSRADLAIALSELTGEEGGGEAGSVAVNDEEEREEAETLAGYEAAIGQVQGRVKVLAGLAVPRYFVGLTPYAAGALFLAVGGGAAYLAARQEGTTEPNWAIFLTVVGLSVVTVTAVAIAGRIAANRQVAAVYGPLAGAFTAARRAATAHHAAAKAAISKRLARAKSTQQLEIAAANEMAAPLLADVDQRYRLVTESIEAERRQKVTRLSRQHKKDRLTAEQRYAAQVKELAEVVERETAAIETAEREQREAIEGGYEADRATTIERWKAVLGPLLAATESTDRSLGIGELTIDLPAALLAIGGAGHAAAGLPVPAAFRVPLSLDMPREANLLVEAGPEDRGAALGLLRVAMLRLLRAYPAGRVRFVLIDPVGLGDTFGSFLHLADYDERLVASRAWTSGEQISRQLADLSDHMETVIQKYLRNEFADIEQYNAQAGVLAEPYRVLVLADFPAGFSAEALQRLSAIVANGPRCGVHVLAMADVRSTGGGGQTAAWLDDLRRASVVLRSTAVGLRCAAAALDGCAFTAGALPDDVELTAEVHRIGAAAKAAGRVEVPFEEIAPGADDFQTLKSDSELVIPIGRAGASRSQMMRLGRGVAQHVVIAGKTGSGKSTLLNTLIVSGALWYRPEELEFYLIDFKKGVEFKPFATHAPPHMKVVAIESDREYGLSVLQRLDAEMSARGELYRAAGVQDLAGYRRVQRESGEESGGAMAALPRCLLIIDEFQEFFSEDDKAAQEASLLLDRLVRQGRAFGVHVILGSQTIGGSASLPRTTLGQMAVRVALQTTEADSQLILGDGNFAARLLSRPGEAIYNDAGGAVEANSPFQVCWLTEGMKIEFLRKAAGGRAGRPMVFEGNEPADFGGNTAVAGLRATPPVAPPRVALAYVGDPVAIKAPTAVPFRRQSGSNLLMVSQQDQPAAAMMATAVQSLGWQYPAGALEFHLVDGTATDSPLAGVLAGVLGLTGAAVRVVDFRATEQGVLDLHEIVRQRRDAGAMPGQGEVAHYLVIAHGQRFRQLRRSEESFSFSMGGDEGSKKVAADKALVEIIRDGPPLGVHVILHVDTMASFDRTFERGVLREFDQRILCQMSQSDSTTLIDSTVANRLGFNRALLFSEEGGTVERFRPYRIPQ